MNKITIVTFFIMLSFISLVSAVTWEDQYAKLTVTPDIAYFSSNGFYQEAELCSKVNSQQSLSLAFLFDRELYNGHIRYAGIDYTNLMQYNYINPQNYGFDSNKRNAYSYQGLIFDPYECKSFDWEYQTYGAGKWDLAAWTGNLFNPSYTWLLDPLFNGTWYINNFTSPTDISDLDVLTNTSIINGTLKLTRIPLGGAMGDLQEDLTSAFLMNESDNTTTFKNITDSIHPAFGAPLHAFELLGGGEPNLANPGINGYAINFQADYSMSTNGVPSGNYLNATESNSEWTLNTWFNPPILNNDNSYLFRYDGASGIRIFTAKLMNDNDIDIYVQDYWGSGHTYSTPYSIGSWNMLTITYNQTDYVSNVSRHNLSIYLNGVLTHSNNISLKDGEYDYWELGGNGGTNLLNALVDEYYVFNKSLTYANVLTMWDGGTGSFFNLSADQTYNTTYGEAISNNISVSYNVPKINLTYDRTNNDAGINISVSNDGGVNWQNLLCNSLDNYYLCNGSVFDTVGSLIKYNITMESYDGGVSNPAMYNITLELVDYFLNVTEVINYSLNTYEGKAEVYSINITSDSLPVNITPYLVLGGVVHTIPNATYNISNLFVNEFYVDVPSNLTMLENYNLTSYFNYSIQFDSSNTSSNLVYFTQSVTFNSSLDNCSSSTVKVLNFTFFDEDTVINPLNVTFEGDFFLYTMDKSYLGNFSVRELNVSVVDICLIDGRELTLDANIFTETDDGFRQRWFLINASVKNGTTSQVNIFNRYSTSGISDLKGTIRSSVNLQLLPNIYGFLQRYYAGEGVWRTVQQDLSDEFGQFFFNIKEEDTDYRIRFQNYTSVLQTTNSMKFICTIGFCDLEFQVNPQGIIGSSNLIYNWTFNNDTGIITVNWNDATGITNAVRVHVQKTGYGQYITICDDTVESSGGSYNCNISSYSGNFLVNVYSSASPLVAAFSFGIIYIVASTLSDEIGNSEGAFWGMGIAVTIAAMGLTGLVPTIISFIIGLTIVWLFNLAGWATLSVIAIAAILGIIIAIRVSR